jgi:sugar lactone lactonase YvrE
LVSALLFLGTVASPAGAATYVESYGGPTSGLFALPQSLATDPQGNLFVSSPFGRGFNKLDPSGNQIFLHSEPGNGDGQFVNGPNGTATDSAGNAYFTDQCTANSCCVEEVDCDTVDRVEVFDENGHFLRDFGTPGSGNGQFEQPSGLATDAAGNVYVADTNNDRIEKLTSSGSYLDQWDGSGDLFEPNDVAVDGSGHVFVTDFDHVRVFTSSGSPITSWDGTGSSEGPLDQPQGIAVDRDGHVYVADKGNDRVQVFDSSGGFLSSFGSGPGGGAGQFGGGPAGVALDCSGHIYVSDPGNNRVQVWSEPGASAIVCGAAALPPSGSSSGPPPGSSTSTAAKKPKCKKKKKKRKHRSASSSKKKCKKKKTKKHPHH